MSESKADEENILLRVKLDNFSVALKKFAQSFLYSEENTSVSLIEPQIVNRLLKLAGGIKSLKSLDGADGVNRTLVDGLQNRCFTTKLHRHKLLLRLRQSSSWEMFYGN